MVSSSQTLFASVAFKRCKLTSRTSAVKGKTLEKMLVRWAMSRRIPPTPTSGDSAWSDCSEPEEHNCGTSIVPVFGHGGSAKAVPPVAEEKRARSQAKGPSQEKPPRLQPPRPTLSERRESQRLTLPGPESEADRAERREAADEKATMLRDDKLISVAGVSGPDKTTPHSDGQSQGQKLTVENVGKLNQDTRSPRSEFMRRSEVSSSPAEAGDESSYFEHGAPERRGGSTRPSVRRRMMDSERTVTGL